MPEKTIDYGTWTYYTIVIGVCLFEWWSMSGGRTPPSHYVTYNALKIGQRVTRFFRNIEVALMERYYRHAL